jgi:NTP pyrophosphatase (non-canonical NTP hydrolase)
MNTPITFNQYQRESAKTAIYPGQGTVQGLLYTGLGLGEAGEVQGKIKKVLRDDDGVLTEDRKAQIIDELSDVLWYCAQTASELDANLGDIAQRNLDKLAARAKAGTIKGSGDNR